MRTATRTQMLEQIAGTHFQEEQPLVRGVLRAAMDQVLGHDDGAAMSDEDHLAVIAALLDAFRDLSIESGLVH